MTIDTSREAVELRLTRLRAAYEQFRAPYGHIAALITQAKLTEKMMDTLLAERDAALAEVARLSTQPDDAEVADLVTLLVDRDNPVGMQAADALTRLSHALTAIERAAYERGVQSALQHIRTWMELEAEDRGEADAEYPRERQCAPILALLTQEGR